MKKFALVGGGKVVNIVVAEDEASIGPAALSLTAIDITDVDAAPSVGSSYDRITKKFTTAGVPDHMKSLVTGDVLVFEAPAAEPAKPAKSSSKTKSSEETAKEE